MNDLQKLWLAALRSGDYRQGWGRLRDNHNKFCCFGVLCDVKDPSKWVESEMNGLPLWARNYGLYLRLDMLEQVRLDYNDQEKLIKMNDSGKSFTEIADYLENLWTLGGQNATT